MLVEYENNVINFNGTKQLKPKVDSHNNITIHPIKDNWNKEEVKQLVEKAYLDGIYDMYDTFKNRKSFTFKGSENAKNWIKQNL